MARRNAAEPRGEYDRLLAHLHDLLASSAAGPRLLALTPPEILADMERAAGGRRSSPIESGEQSPDEFRTTGRMLPAGGSAERDFFTSAVKNESPESGESYQRSAGIYSPAGPFSRTGGEKIGLNGPSKFEISEANEDAQHQAGETFMATTQNWDAGWSGVEVGHQAPPAGGEIVVRPSEDGLAEPLAEAALAGTTRAPGSLEPSDAALVVYEPGSEPTVVPPRAIRRGRPVAVDEACKNRIVSLMGYGMSLRQAAARVGVHHTALLKAMDRDEQFADQVAEARMDAAAQPLMTVIRASRSNWRAAAWLAKHLSQRQWMSEHRDEREHEAARLAELRKQLKRKGGNHESDESDE
jgi:hypothetical protein